MKKSHVIRILLRWKLKLILDDILLHIVHLWTQTEFYQITILLQLIFPIALKLHQHQIFLEFLLIYNIKVFCFFGLIIYSFLLFDVTL